MILQEDVIKFSTENLQLKPKFNKKLAGSAVFEALTDSFVQQFDVMQSMENYAIAKERSDDGIANTIDYLNYIGGEDFDIIVDAISGAVAEDITFYRTNIKPHLERAYERTVRALSNVVTDMALIRVQHEGRIFENADLLSFLSVSSLDGINYQHPMMQVRNSETVDTIMNLLKEAVAADELGEQLLSYMADFPRDDLKVLIGELFFGHRRDLFSRFYSFEAKVFFMPHKTYERQLLLAAYFIMKTIRRNADKFEFEGDSAQYLEVCERLLGQPILKHMQEIARKRTGPIGDLILVKAHNAQLTKDNRVCVEEIAFERLRETQNGAPEIIVGAVISNPGKNIYVKDLLEHAPLYQRATQRYYEGRRNNTLEENQRKIRKEVMACICDYRDNCEDEVMVKAINHRLINGTDMWFPRVDMSDSYALTQIWNAVFEAFHVYVFNDFGLMGHLSHLTQEHIKEGEDPQDTLTKRVVEDQVVRAVMQLAQRKQANA